MTVTVWKSQPCKLDEVATLLNEIEGEGREVFSVIPLTHGYAVVLSRIKEVFNQVVVEPKSKKGRK